MLFLSIPSLLFTFLLVTTTMSASPSSCTNKIRFFCLRSLNVFWKLLPSLSSDTSCLSFNQYWSARLSPVLAADNHPQPRHLATKMFGAHYPWQLDFQCLLVFRLMISQLKYSLIFFGSTIIPSDSIIFCGSFWRAAHKLTTNVQAHILIGLVAQECFLPPRMNLFNFLRSIVLVTFWVVETFAWR